MYDPARDIFTSSEDAAAEPGARRDSSTADAAKETPNDAVMNAEPQIKQSPHRSGLPNRNGTMKEEIQANHSNFNGQPAMPLQRCEKRARSPEPHTEFKDTASAHQQSPKKSSSPRAATARDDADGPVQKRVKKLSSNTQSNDYDASPEPLTTANLPRFSRKKPSSDSAHAPRRTRSPRDGQPRRNRSRSPGAYRRSRSPIHRSPFARRRERHYSPRRRSTSPPPRPRTPSPPPRSPPRKLRRPGGAARISAAEKEALRQRQIEREQEEIRNAQKEVATRGVQEVVKQHYNTVPQRGREWRTTASKIRGLRSFNNWVKSTVIQKFSPSEDFTPGGSDNTRFAEGLEGGGHEGETPGLLVLDMGCGKGGDLQKWAQAPQRVDLYVGVDPADVSIEQARERYRGMRGGGRGGGRGGKGGFRGGRGSRIFDAHFFVQDGFAEWLGEIPIIRDVGIDGGVGPGGQGATSARWGGGGFDIVTMMFCMHYAFESAEKARGMLKNVAGALKKGGRFIGVIPNSDVLSKKVVQFHKSMAKKKEEAKDQDGGKEDTETEEVCEFGNSIYRVRFPGSTPKDGIFRPPFGWKYSYFMEESVEDVPEYVVPWEAFRALAEDYNLELQYRKPFAEVWKEENDDPILGPLSERMGVREKGRGPLLVSDEEMEAASFYVAFCFYKS